MRFTKYIVFSLIITLFSSCGEYYKIKESNDPELQYTKALEYYKAKEYAKSEYLFNAVISIYRGTSKYEDVSYYYVMSLYHQEFYSIAAHYFSLFVNTFPQSPRLEEAYYLSAYCYFLNSPELRLDQANTVRAINSFLKYIKLYPESDRIPAINGYIDDSRNKLTKKSFINARLYYDREKYKSAIVALNNSLNDFPESIYREDIKFLLLQSYFLYAKNSIATQQDKRYKEAREAAESFFEEFPESKLKEDVESINEEINIYLN